MDTSFCFEHLICMILILVLLQMFYSEQVWVFYSFDVTLDFSC